MKEVSVLIVSDEIGIAEQFQQKLKHVQSLIVICCTIEEAIESDRKHNPDLIFIKFREMRKKIEALQKIPPNFSKPVVFLPAGFLSKQSESDMVENMVRSMQRPEE